MRFLPLLLLFPALAGAQSSWQSTPDPRARISLNADWRFLPDGIEFAERPVLSDERWARVNVPHTWNAIDPFDDEDSYRRGTGWYRRKVAVPDSLRGKRLFLHFEGVNQTADVYVNGAFVGRHVGGYTAFTMDATDRLRVGADSVNLLAVRVDNSHDPMVAPLSVGFALYGGIYRDVWLVATDPLHVTMADHGGPGLYVTTPAVSQASGVVEVRGAIANASGTARTVRVQSAVVDDQGRIAAQGSTDVVAPLNGEGKFAITLPAVVNPRLWSPEQPNLYTVHTTVMQGGVVRDRVSSPLGFRWFEFHPDSGFSLNGRKYVLRGTNRHQDYAGLGSALPNRLHVRDLEIVKEMGANFLRLAHYPQDPVVLDAADRLGLILWEEAPVVNYATRHPEFVANSQRMLREMIRQHHNHPSVAMWGTMNEIFLWSEQGARIGTQWDTTYTRWVRDIARGMDSVARAEDPTRYTAMAIHGSGDYDKSGVSDVPQVLGVNLYNGWYSGTIDQFGRAIDRLHERHPKQTIFVSEYGSGSDLALNSAEPERFDHSGVYHRLFHEGYLRQSRERRWLGGTAIWNQFDFSQPHIGEPLPNLNKKGMLTFDRRYKDVFYMYKANWDPTPMVYIASRDWAHRGGVQRAANAAITQPVDVYSNQGRVELIVNGRSLGAKTPDDVKKATWQVPFMPGENVIEARATGGARVTDRMVIHMDHLPADLRNATTVREIAVNVGSRAQYRDRDGEVWYEDQPYTPGSFGYTGSAGTPTMFDRNFAITHTDRSGMYFTYRLGIEGYRFDVPAGEYLVELYLVEGQQLAPGERVFDVLANGRLALPRIDLAATSGFRRAAMHAFTTSVRNGEGLQLAFRAIAGKPLVSGIRIVRQ